MKKYLSIAICFLSLQLLAQKKPLDHSVYDSWQSITEKLISNNGKYVAFLVTPQEGDATLYIKTSTGTLVATIDRGYTASFSENSEFLICKIKPFFKETRDAKIKKKKAEEMPKDSLAIITLSNGSVEKIAKVKSYKTPEDGNYVAWLMDSDKKVDKEDEVGTMAWLHNFKTGKRDSLRKVTEYYFDKNGNSLVYELKRGKKDSVLKSAIVWINLNTNKADTLKKDFTEAGSFSLNDDGDKLAYVLTNDTSKAEQKEYNLFYHQANSDKVVNIGNDNKAIPTKWRINENAKLDFSKKGNRLFFGTSPQLPAKDTSLPEFERVNVDIWHYNEDDLQTVQLKNLDNDLKKSYTAVLDLSSNTVTQLADKKFERIYKTLEGDGSVFYTTSDYGKRVAKQWQGYTFDNIYTVNPATGEKKLIKENFKGTIYPSYTGKYLLMYDEVNRKYFCYNSSIQKTTIVAADIPYALYDEENDVPDFANNYGIVKWMENDTHVLVYDRYDVWKVDAEGKSPSISFTNGRKTKTQYRFINTDEDEKYLKDGQKSYFKIYNEKSKLSAIEQLGLYKGKYFYSNNFNTIASDSQTINTFIKAKNDSTFVLTQESTTQSANIFSSTMADSTDDMDCNSDHPCYITTFKKALSNINPQQSNYNWLTAELFKWKAYTGKETEGILYKPENFDPKKKYPMIVYFYERNNQTLYNYQAPAPTPSRLNIPFFVSRGYIVFVPDIWYKTGKPAQSAYDYIVSGTRAVVKLGFVDSTKMGLQGQSWGGYQTAQLITMTNLYAAAWAGAPVSNMFSAYGGIRWESGLNRQFQYEHTQSRIGATIWEKPNLYIENSPLFHLPKVKTPLVIMSNDKDGAVPWYQGIELFTSLRRLNKPVWMLNYNDEAHNLMERKNRKDIQIREQQYFDWLLKGEKPATWLAEGVPAIMKGRTWGL